MRAALLLLLLVLIGMKIYPVLTAILEKLPFASNWIKVFFGLGGLSVFVAFGFILAAFIGLLLTKSPEKLGPVPASTIISGVIGSIDQKGGTTTVFAGDKFRPVKDRIIETLDSFNPDIMVQIHRGTRYFKGTIPMVFSDQILKLAAEDRTGVFIRANTFNNIVMGGGFGPQTTIEFTVTDELVK